MEDVKPSAEQWLAEADRDTELLDLLAAAPPGFRALRRGEVVDAVVVQVNRDEILVDIGTKAEAVIPLQESGAPHGDLSQVAKIGDTVLAMVVEPEGREGHAILSLARAQVERGWRVLQRVFEDGTTIQAAVVDANRGGLIVNAEGLRGFIPLSQVVDLRQSASPDEPVEARLERMKGRVLDLKLVEVNRRRNRLILSERLASQERRAAERDRLFEEIEEGQTRAGRVSSICDFGAFVDMGGADGLVHLSELSWTPVGNPGDVVHVGDQVEVLVLGVDRERRKIALSLKRLKSQPWDSVPERYSVGQNVVARVTKLVTFGAFVEIEPGVEGLVHISELTEERIQHPKSVVREGDVLTVKILRIEPERRRLGLSLRQAQAEAAEAEVAGLPMVYGGVEEPEDAAMWMGGARVIQEQRPLESFPTVEGGGPSAEAELVADLENSPFAVLRALVDEEASTSDARSADAETSASPVLQTAEEEIGWSPAMEPAEAETSSPSVLRIADEDTRPADDLTAGKETASPLDLPAAANNVHSPSIAACIAEAEPRPAELMEAAGDRSSAEEPRSADEELLPMDAP